MAWSPSSLALPRSSTFSYSLIPAADGFAWSQSPQCWRRNAKYNVSVYRLILLGFATGVLAFAPTNVSAEKHHTLVFENSRVRVYRLTLAPAQATGLHLHSHPYAYLALQDAQISNEAPGHEPRVVDVTAGDVHISKGGFMLVERNAGSQVADLLVIEQLGDGAPFSDPVADYGVHEAALGAIFERPGMRAYATRMSVAGRTEAHPESHDRLIVAITDLELLDKTPEQGASTLKLKSGEVKWLAKGGTHTLSNTGNAACSFLTFEFP